MQDGFRSSDKKKERNAIVAFELEPLPGIVLRRATKADFEGVKELTKTTLQSNDFLTSYYMRYIEDPERFIYLALKKAKW